MKKIHGLNRLKFLPAFLFAVLILIGSFIYKDYGISVDEPQQREIGKTSLNFLGHYFNLPTFIDPNDRHASAKSVFEAQRDRDYGVAFELPAEFLIKMFGVEDEKIFYFRHYLNFILYAFSLLCFYRLLLLRHKDIFLALLGSIFLLLSPRIFGDAFYNTKDLAFLSFIVIASYTLVRYLLQPSIMNCIWHGIATALAIDIRIMGAVMIGITGIGLLAQVYMKRSSLIVFVRQITTYLILTFGFVIIFWPWLWLDPFGHFVEAFQNMSKFRTNLNMLFFGDMIWSGNLPWLYVPTWITLTTPLLYLALFLVGIFALATPNKTIISNEGLIDYLFLALFLMPIISVIILKSVLYNGWRHLYFVYPALIYISVRGYVYLATQLKTKAFLKVLVAIVFTSLCNTAFWMIKDHPHQYLYFNILAKDWIRQFDVDYWGVAYKNSLQKIVDQTATKKVAIFSNVYYDENGRFLGDFPGQTIWQRTPFESVLMLSPVDQEKLILHRKEECSDYIFLTIRSQKYPEYLKRGEFELVDTVKSGNQIVYGIFKRKMPLEGGLLEIQPNQPIIFSDPNTHCFLPKGWSDSHEDWGIWSTAKKTRIELPIPKSSTRVKLDLRAFVGGTLKKQMVQISIQGNSSQKFQLNHFESNIIELKLPSSKNSNEVLRIDLSLPTANSPKELGLSEDQRILGVGLKNITFLR